METKFDDKTSNVHDFYFVRYLQHLREPKSFRPSTFCPLIHTTKVSGVAGEQAQCTINACYSRSPCPMVMSFTLFQRPLLFLLSIQLSSLPLGSTWRHDSCSIYMCLGFQVVALFLLGPEGSLSGLIWLACNLARTPE